MKSPFFFFLIPAIALFITASYMNAGKAKPATGGTVEFTDANFQSKVLSSNKLTIVDFWAEWCGPCKMIAPILDELADEYEGRVTIAKVNIDEQQGIAAEYGIRAIPTLLLFDKGQVADQIVGLRSKRDLKASFDRVAV